MARCRKILANLWRGAVRFWRNEAHALKLAVKPIFSVFFTLGLRRRVRLAPREQGE